MKELLLKLLERKGEMTVSELVGELGISRQMIHRLLKALQEEGLVKKLGKPPVTYYQRTIESEKEIKFQGEADEEKEAFLKKHFLLITETGDYHEGLQAMIAWCRRQKLPIEKTIDEFIKTKRKYLSYVGSNGLISGIDKINNTKGFDSIGLDELYYQDFYAIERFGKTRLGTQLHFAKQGQNRTMMKSITDEIRPNILKLISALSIDAVGYIPPTIKREIQIMQVFRNNLNLSLPHLDLIKVKGEVVVPQKALSKLEDRINNARSSIMIGENRYFRKILLIDDAVGSGATLNETALKLKRKGICDTVIGYAVTGSFKGLDVLQEV